MDEKQKREIGVVLDFLRQAETGLNLVFHSSALSIFPKNVAQCTDAGSIVVEIIRESVGPKNESFRERVFTIVRDALFILQNALDKGNLGELEPGKNEAVRALLRALTGKSESEAYRTYCGGIWGSAHGMSRSGQYA